MSHKDPDRRREYQRQYYASLKQREIRSAYRRAQRKKSRVWRIRDRKNSARYRHRLRLKVFLRDQGRCHYCLVTIVFNTFQMDHKIPLRDRGRTVFENLVASCVSCNRKKNYRYSYEAFLCLMQPDYVPAWISDSAFPEEGALGA